MNISSSIDKFFKPYDVRGTTPELSPELFYWIGNIFFKNIIIEEKLPKQFLLGHDCRLSSKDLYTAFYNGFLDAGGQILPLGEISTDYLYGATQALQLPGGIITASHNPKDDNGLKIVKRKAQMLGLNSGLDKIRDEVKKYYQIENINFSNFKKPILDLKTKEIVDEYFISKLKTIGNIDNVNDILKSKNRKLRIAVDAGNGMGGFIMKNFLINLYDNIEFLELYWNPDGNYPNHPADPQKPENLLDLQNLIKKEKNIDFGIAFDGDGDRAFFLDEKGELINGDYLVAFFTKTLIQDWKIRNKNNPKLETTAVYIEPGSKCVVEAISENGAIAIPSKQGHLYIKEMMSKYNAVYGGEFSGHHYFSDFGNMDSGALAVVLMIKIFVEKNTSLSSIFDVLKKNYFISDLQTIYLENGLTFEIIKDKLTSYFKDATISYFDGISIYYPDWKFNIRPSGTEPIVRFILETRIVNKTEEKLQLVKKVLGIIN